MKTIICIFFIFIILLQSAGLLFFQIQQLAAQYEMHEKIENSRTKFEKLTLSQHDYRKSIVRRNEIILDGKMYDVKSISIEGDNVHLLAIHDSHEESIIHKIKALVSFNNKPYKQRSVMIIKFISLVYLLPSFENLREEKIDSNIIFLPPFLNLLSRNSDIFSPPPNRFIS